MIQKIPQITMREIAFLWHRYVGKNKHVCQVLLSLMDLKGVCKGGQHQFSHPEGAEAVEQGKHACLVCDHLSCTPMPHTNTLLQTFTCHTGTICVCVLETHYP